MLDVGVEYPLFVAEDVVDETCCENRFNPAAVFAERFLENRAETEDSCDSGVVGVGGDSPLSEDNEDVREDVLAS